MAEKFDHYEKDQAVFRGPAGRQMVTEVLLNGEWKPYTGSDKVAPVVYGNKITAEQAGGPAA